MKAKNIILILVFLIIGAGAGYYIWSDYLGEVKPPLGGLTSKAPSLERQINISATLQEETKEMFRTKIEELRTNLKEDAGLRSSWLDLASYYNLIGDYEGAEEVWKYMAFEDGSDFVPLYNLGDLYGYYMKNYPEAERYFKKAVEINPGHIATYASFYSFYVEAYTEKSDLAEGVLLQGLEANPGDPQLTALLEMHRKN